MQSESVNQKILYKDRTIFLLVVATLKREPCTKQRGTSVQVLQTLGARPFPFSPTSDVTQCFLVAFGIVYLCCVVFNVQVNMLKRCETGLNSFFVFNSTFGPREGEVSLQHLVSHSNDMKVYECCN